MKKFKTLLLCLAVLMAVVASVTAYATDATLVVGRPAKGMYCADPAGWINQGYRIYVWGNATPVKAQVFDVEGNLLLPSGGVTWRVPSTGQTGSMTIGDTLNKVYTGTPTSVGADRIYTGNTPITYTASGKTFTDEIRRWNAKCDGCHTTPVTRNNHLIANAGSNGASTCRTSTCHPYFGAKMMQSHAFRVPVAEQTTSEGCYRCHPAPCYAGVHAGKFPGDSIGCVTCHGTMIDAANGQMKVPGQLGFPRCENCHTTPPGTTIPYAQNAGKEYKASVGHGRPSGPDVLCITCHNSMHKEEKPSVNLKWGDGVNNNCVKCHIFKANNPQMGPVCGNCHRSSIDPHQTTHP